MSRINLWEAWPVSSCERRLTGPITSHKLQRLQQGKYLVGGLIRTLACLWVVAFFQGATLQKVYEIDPLLCPFCGGEVKILSFIIKPKIIKKIVDAYRSDLARVHRPSH